MHNKDNQYNVKKIDINACFIAVQWLKNAVNLAISIVILLVK
ncbi:hypothetical protein CRENPOLYSF1_190075 [Crenothrix polyspora]|uniref:Uncharacterized protein n=1 Tax=Crenothrix polyspora TaxID=360316 RepID=A0A1R4H6D3_9GAMM|nr:hypothetical protein CRENPOLYSF1_190075 [Crenothrix polyspora]